MSLRQNQITAAKFLAQGVTQEQAAKMAGVKLNTLKTWLRLDAMRAEIQERQRESLGGMVGMAIRTLRDLLNDAETPHAVRLKAATEVLDRCGFTAEAPDSATFHVELRLDAGHPARPDPIGVVHDPESQQPATHWLSDGTLKTATDVTPQDKPEEISEQSLDQHLAVE